MRPSQIKKTEHILFRKIGDRYLYFNIKKVEDRNVLLLFYIFTIKSVKIVEKCDIINKSMDARAVGGKEYGKEYVESRSCVYE